MDPDGLDILISFIGGIFAIILFWCAGSLLSNDSEKDQQTSIGLSFRFTGVVICLIFSIGMFTYGLLQIFVKTEHLIIVSLCIFALCVIGVISAGFGGLHGKDDPENFVLFRPVGVIGSALALLIFKALNLKVHENVTEEDFLNLVDDVAQDEVINQQQKEMITNIVELHDVTAGEIMTHRREVIAVPSNTKVGEVVLLAAKNGVSRLPVYHKTMDDIVGILYAKDLFTLWDDEDKSELSVEKFVRKAIFVPESQPARVLLIEFMAKHTQIAIVVDEYGGTSGIVTMEDVLEEIVGNIQDEFDHEDEDFVRREDGSVIATGSADLEELFEILGLPALNDDEYEYEAGTVGGFVFDKLGHIPAKEEPAFVQFNDILFTVLKASDRRIESVLCEHKPIKNFKSGKSSI